MWSATFGSARRHEARVFSYAVAAHAPDIYQGITVGNSRPWSGPVPSALPFDTADFSVDSDAAYQTASAQATAWLSKNPGREASFPECRLVAFLLACWISIPHRRPAIRALVLADSVAIPARCGRCG